ncbi:MAG TPA: hypothetical protein VKV80_04745 [Streptosporangiaceae bacterium]|nr:hypothetical protein [Streptosporangiaceae bacterium]
MRDELTVKDTCYRLGMGRERRTGDELMSRQIGPRLGEPRAATLEAHVLRLEARIAAMEARGSELVTQTTDLRMRGHELTAQVHDLGVHSRELESRIRGLEGQVRELEKHLEALTGAALLLTGGVDDGGSPGREHAPAAKPAPGMTEPLTVPASQ